MTLGQIACSACDEDVGYTPTGNEDTGIAVEATSREKLYFRGSLNNHSLRKKSHIKITNQIASTLKNLIKGNIQLKHNNCSDHI